MPRQPKRQGAKAQKPQATPKHFRLSDKAIACLAVAGLFEDKTESAMVDELICTHLGQYAAYCGGRKYTGSVALSTISDSANTVHEGESPMQIQS